VPGWSIVSLFDKQHSRALVLEWSAFSLLLQSAFMVLWVSVMLVALARGASWLWPDPLRRPRYRGLAALYAGALVLWLAVARFAEVRTAFYAGVAMPVALWWYRRARGRPPGVGRRGLVELHRDYRVTGALFLLWPWCGRRVLYSRRAHRGLSTSPDCAREQRTRVLVRVREADGRRDRDHR
jgi:hypothetical protein